MRTRGGVLRRSAVRSRVRTRGRAGASRVVLQDSIPWTRSSFRKDFPALLQPSYRPSEPKSSLLEYFYEYIDKDLLRLVVTMSNQTAVEKTGKSLNLTVGECKAFVAITMLMGCIGYPQIRMYWSEKYAVPIIVRSMVRDRYFLLRNSLKLVYDNDISTNMRKDDLLWKVRPLLDRVLQGCHGQIREQKISIDEMIIPFTGACPMRQYCPGKPNPTGLKAFILANPNGLVCDIIVYQGKNTGTKTGNGDFNLGESVVLTLTETLVPGHVIYCDRFFTSIKLMDELHKRGFKCAGTIMKNRLPKYVLDNLQTDKQLARQGRGSYDVLVREDKQVALTKWYDNKPVMLLSSIHAAETVDECRRYDRKLRSYVHVQRPEVVKEYNSNMGGVDLTGRLLAVCPSRMRTKKWTVRFISHFIDLSVVNAWIKYKADQKLQGVRSHKIFQLRSFKQFIAEKILDDYLLSENEIERATAESSDVLEEVSTTKRGRPPVKAIPSAAFRQRGSLHLPAMRTSQHRCRQKNCVMKTTVYCQACDLPLCFTAKRNCFADFHLIVST